MQTVITQKVEEKEYTHDLHKICGSPVITVTHSTQNPHLIPIFSLCFCRARSAIDCDANWTYASPEARPISSANRAIPLGTICIPVNPHINPQNITINPTHLSQQSLHYTAQSLQILVRFNLQCSFAISELQSFASDSASG